MALQMVTLTGADETIDPKELGKISKLFPFVEWGILIGSKTGSRRPSPEWIKELVDVRMDLDNRMQLSLHVCGRRLESIVQGKPDFIVPMGWTLAAFGRVQLNFHGERQPSNADENILQSMCQLEQSGMSDPHVIFQLDGVNDELYRATMRRFLCMGLFDKSHGGGVKPDEWPKPLVDIRCGWAGGLGPDNIREELAKIDAANTELNGPFGYWIDMETKLFTDGQFDLTKCVEVLSECRPYVKD